MQTNYIANMKTGTGSIIKKVVTSKQHKYETLFIYVPTLVAKDSAFMFEAGEKVNITIDVEKQRLIVEKEKNKKDI